MFDFDKQYKEFERLNERTKQVYEFWLKVVTSTWEDIFKLKSK